MEKNRIEWASLPLGLSGRRDIAAACVCPSVRPSVCLSVCLSVCPSVRPQALPCPQNNSSQINPGIAKFVPNMHYGILSVGIEQMSHWPWLSGSFGPFWLIIWRNLASLCYILSQITARINKLEPNLNPGILLAGIKDGGHWPWPSRSFGHFDFEF